MMIRILIVLLILATLPGCNAGIAEGKSETGNNALDAKLIAGRMNALLQSRPGSPFSGAILIKQGDRVVYSCYTGDADRERKLPVTINSQFVIGSVSKQFTAVLILLELEQGHVRLSDTIGKYLPQIRQPWKDSVTIYQLLTHTHGIVSLDKPLAFNPGSMMDYSRGNNIGYLLLSRILEQVSGKSFAALTQALFDRCGMSHTFHPATKGYHHLVKGYTQQENGAILADSMSAYAVPAAGGMISNTADLARWDELLFSGKILKPETYKQFTAIQPGVVEEHSVWGVRKFGLGITVRDDDRFLRLGQTGLAPGFVSMNFYFPESKVTVIALQNVFYNPRDMQDVYYYHVRIIDMLRSMMGGNRETFKRKNFVHRQDTLLYRLMYPENETKTKKYPLVIYLHGSGSRGSDNEKPLQNLPSILVDSTMKVRHPCFVLVPQCPESDAWVSFPGFPGSLASVQTKAQRSAIELIRHLVAVENIDPQRIYLTGYSLGAEGTYDMIARAPDLFACGVPLAGLGDTSKAVLLKGMPLWAFHGTDDKVNDIEYDRMMVKSIRQNGGTIKLTEFRGVGHDCKKEAYGKRALWEWMFDQVRK